MNFSKILRFRAAGVEFNQYLHYGHDPTPAFELSPELALEKGIANLDWVRISSPRASVRAKALVTRRMRPLVIDGRTVHQVGMPWHWGYEGVVTGDIVNEMSPLVGDPNVSIHEGKAFVCNVEKA